MIKFIKKKFHKLCYRFYINGKNYYNNNIDNSIHGLSKISFTKNLTCGDNVSFGGEVMILGNGKITIGGNTMIGAGTIIHSSTHDYKRHPMTDLRIDNNTTIGKHVWIGAGVIINPGVTINDYAVIGSGSVVTKDVKSGSIAVGVPAKIIKERDLNKILTQN